ncbi:MAG: DnaB-like helicase C-terminal domain-containing protein [Candidatus Woesearchaeota archaeon]
MTNKPLIPLWQIREELADNAFQQELHESFERMRLSPEEEQSFLEEVPSLPGFDEREYLQQQNNDLKNNSQFSLQRGRIPPQNVELEEITLRTYFSNPKWMQDWSQPYLNRMFYKPAHRHIHEAMMNCQQPISKRTVITHLRQKGLLDVVGGEEYITELLKKETAQSPEELQAHILSLEDHHVARELILFSNNVTKAAYTGGLLSEKDHAYALKKKYTENSGQQVAADSIELVRQVSFQVLEVLPFRHRTQYSLDTQVEEAVEDARGVYEREGKPKVSTGFKELDAVTHGAPNGRLYIAGARPKNGKTTLAVNLADNIMEQGAHAAIFSHELSYKELTRKFIAKRADVDLEKFSYADEENPFTKEELERIEYAAQEVKQLPLTIRSGPPNSVEDIVNQAAQIKAWNPNLQFIAIDGLQAYGTLVPPRSNKSDFFYNILNYFKNDIAERLGVTVWLSAQLLRGVEKYKASKPKGIDDFSDCKGIAEVADGAFLLYRPEHYFPDNEEFRGWMNVHPVDLRNSGRKGKQFKLGIDISRADMYELK